MQQRIDKADNTRLFKYLDSSSGELMLSGSNIQFTRATKLNDPFDCYEELLDFSTYESCYFQQCGSNANQKELFERQRKTIMVCSLSKIQDSILMWSYYNQHKGVCIGLDMDKVRKCFGRDYSGISDLLATRAVDYKSSFEKLDYFANQEESLRYIVKTKASDWSHESEVRMVVPAVLCSKEYMNGDYWRPKIDGKCFVSIYLGVNIDDCNKRKIIRLAQKLNPDIEIYQMNVNPNAFKLDCEKIQQNLMMKKHNCENCPVRARHDKNPRSLVGRFWRWHIGFCPGWKKYFDSLDEAKKTELRQKYNLKWKR